MQSHVASPNSPQERIVRCGEGTSGLVAKGLLFDLDFTLIHSWWWPVVMIAYAASHGVELSFYEFLEAKPVARGLFQWLVDYLQKEGVTVSKIEVERSCWALMKTLTNSPYFVSEELAVRREDLAELQARGIPLGIVTNRPREELQRTLTTLHLESFLSVTISRDDVSKPKPDPEGILKAVKLLGLPPGEVIYFGDSTGDMEAAKAAGVIPMGVINNTFMWERIRALLIQAGAADVCCLGHCLHCCLYGGC